jgi:hypothetical protein
MLNGGSGMAGPIWVGTMKQGLAGVANTQFTVPSGIVQKPVCYSNGGLSSASGNGTYNEYFLSSALPTTTCSPTKTEQKTEDKPKETITPDTTKPDTTTGSGDGSTGTGDTDTGTGSGGTGTGNGSGNGNGSGTGTGGGTTTPVVPPITTP